MFRLIEKEDEVTLALAKETFSSFPLLIKKYAASLKMCRSVAVSAESARTTDLSNEMLIETIFFIYRWWESVVQ